MFVYNISNAKGWVEVCVYENINVYTYIHINEHIIVEYSNLYMKHIWWFVLAKTIQVDSNNYRGNQLGWADPHLNKRISDRMHIIAVTFAIPMQINEVH